MAPSTELNCSSRGRNIPHPHKGLDTQPTRDHGSAQGQCQGGRDMTSQHKTLADSSNQHRAQVATEKNHQGSHQNTRSNGEVQQNTWGQPFTHPTESQNMDE